MKKNMGCSRKTHTYLLLKEFEIPPGQLREIQPPPGHLGLKLSLPLDIHHLIYPWFKDYLVSNSDYKLSLFRKTKSPDE